MKPQILLTFDLEEFDLPLEFGHPISDEDQIKVSNEGLERLNEILSNYDIPATFFTTAAYAVKNKAVIKDLSENHEIASHSKHHSSFSQNDISESKKEIERITGKQVHGFRMPRFNKIDLSLIKAAGYRYDSSINPTYIPGRYNNLSANRKLHIDTTSNLIEIPVSVSPFIRIPLFWLSLKNLPLQIYLLMCKMAIRKDSYLHLCFHPWEFSDLEHFIIPQYIKKPSGNELSGRFEKLIAGLRNTGEYSTISNFLDTYGTIQ